MANQAVNGTPEHDMGAGLNKHESPGVSSNNKQEGQNVLMHQDTQRYSSNYITVCLVGYAMSFIIFGSQVSILGPTIKPLADVLNVSEPDLSPLFTALGISCIISGPPSGWLVDRVPTHRVLLGSLIVQAIGFALVPFMPSIWTLTTLYFIICFSYNFTNSAVFTSLGWMFPKRAGSALNLVLAMFGVGSLMIPLAAQACKYLLGSALAVFWVVSAVSVLAAIPFLFMTSPTPPPPATGENGDALPEDKVPKKALFYSQLTTYLVVFLVFCTTAAETAIGNWLFTYGVRQEGLSDDAAALGNSAFWGSFTVGRVVGAAVSHMTTPATLLLSSTPLAILGASLPIWAGAFLEPWWLVVATAVLTGMGNSTGYANAISLLERYVPVTGWINGVFGMVAGGACMVGPTTVAMLAKYTDLKYTAMAWVGGTFYIMHVPLILGTMVAGNTLLSILSGAAGDDDDNAAASAAEEGSLIEPLLINGSHHEHNGHYTPSTAVPMPTGGRLSEETRVAGSAVGHAGVCHPRISVGSLGRHAQTDGTRLIGQRASLPGHASPMANSLQAE